MLPRRLVIAAVTGLALARAGHADDRPRMRVFRDPGCDCCRGWVRHMEQAGFDVQLEECGLN